MSSSIPDMSASLLLTQGGRQRTLPERAPSMARNVTASAAAPASGATSWSQVGRTATGTGDPVNAFSPRTGPMTSASSQTETTVPAAAASSIGMASVIASSSACDLAIPSAASLVSIAERLRAEAASENSTASAVSPAAAAAPARYSSCDSRKAASRSVP